jgi:hypothetical protein
VEHQQGLGHQGGTLNTGVIYGGGNPAVTTSAEYNGTAWTAGNNANSAGTSGQGFGSLTAGVIASRASSGGGPTPAVVEEYNGTSWSEVNEVNTGRAGYERSSSGPQTAGIIYGGGVDGSGVTGVVESYNGTSWTEIADVNTARQEGGGFGLQSDAIFAGGFNPGAIVALTESWNGSAWTEVAQQKNGRHLNIS